MKRMPTATTTNVMISSFDGDPDSVALGVSVEEVGGSEIEVRVRGKLHSTVYD